MTLPFIDQTVRGKNVAAEQAEPELLQKFDPLALSPLVKDRTLYYFSKRVLDITVAALALLLLWPVMVVVAILIILDSEGPILFKQERIGAQRRIRAGCFYWQQTTFTCYKFRSMCQNANPALHQAYVLAFINNDQQRMAELQGWETQTHKLVSDPRVTRVGRIIRKSSLDELPQLWNVLKGDMSLVGPRPAVPYEVNEYQLWHRRRLRAKPGLTGLWQVMARSSADFEEMIRLDIQYVERQSFWLDCMIILSTPWAVLSGKGAV
jgi:lipopolysaccharide/colanic/teichoic acid biosynthesis glycosyltransferase